MCDKIAVVNGLRGIAILGVFIIHFVGSHVPADSGWLGALIWTGWFGVPLFFMLSGFVLYLPFAAGRQLDTLRFYWHRLARLYPLYMIAGLMSLIINGDSTPLYGNFWKHVLELLTVSYYFDMEGTAVETPVGNGALWSLAVEFYMSALFPLLVLWIARWNTVQVAIGFILGTAFLKILYIGAGLAAFEGEWWSLTLWKLLQLMQGLTEFSLGMWLAVLWQQDKLRQLTPYASALFFAAVLPLLYIITLQPMNHGPFPLGLHALFFPAADILLTVVVACVLALPKGIIRGILTCWPLQIIGAMCFSIYVWHEPLVRHLGSNHIERTALNGAIYTIACFAMIMLFSAFSYRFIEFPNKPWRELFLFPPRRHG